MKPNDWLARLGNIDPKYIEEADPGAPSVKSSNRGAWKRWAVAAAACFLCVLMVALPLLLLPFDTPTSGTDTGAPHETDAVTLRPRPTPVPTYDDYSHVIHKLDAYMEQLDGTGTGNSGSAGDILYGDDVDMAPSDDFVAGSDGSVSEDTTDQNFTSSLGSSAYQEVTDNQVAGVIEADCIKRTNTHIFYLRTRHRPNTDILYSRSMFIYTLEVYTIAGEQSVRVGSYTLPDLDTAGECYLSADGRTFTVIMYGKVITDKGKSHTRTSVISLDVSDPADIRQKGEVTVDGSYISSRMVDGRLLLVTRHFVSSRDYDKTDPATFIPTLDAGDGAGDICLPSACITVPEDVASSAFTVLVSLNESDLCVTDCCAVLDAGYYLYASRSTLYLYGSKWDSERRHPGTKITGIYYADGMFTYDGCILLRGNLYSQYNLDEYNGILRAVTTVASEGKTNASLFCVELSTWNVVASVENFAPPGEVVRSVRFDGNTAYVCTSIQTNDPVFYFDLSDLENITVKDTGEIDGFSSSLIQLGDGYLLGVGQDDNGWKIEVYRETDTGVSSVAIHRASRDQQKYNPRISGNYKSYLIDRERGLIGFTYAFMSDTTGEHAYYLLLRFDKSTGAFTEIVKQKLSYPNAFNGNNNRGVIVDGYLYLFCYEKDFFVIKLENI